MTLGVALLRLFALETLDCIALTNLGNSGVTEQNKNGIKPGVYPRPKQGSGARVMGDDRAMDLQTT